MILIQSAVIVLVAAVFTSPIHADESVFDHPAPVDTRRHMPTRYDPRHLSTIAENDSTNKNEARIHWLIHNLPHHRISMEQHFETVNKRHEYIMTHESRRSRNLMTARIDLSVWHAKW